MTWRRLVGLFGLVACVLVIGACGTDESDDSGGGGTAGAEKTTESKESQTGEQSEFFVQEDYDRQLAQRTIEPEGDAATPWEQAIEPEMADTSKYKTDKASGWNICFSNAANDNPWRQTGFKTMKQEVKLHDEIGEVHGRSTPRPRTTSRSPTSSRSSPASKCDALIVSPNTTATLTPAVEEACKSDIPIVVFDRGVDDGLPGHVHPSDRRLRLRCGRGRVPGRQRGQGRQDPRAADPARAWTSSRPAGRAPRASSTRPT